MTYRGIVKQGKVELEQGTPLSDGTPVRVEPEITDWRSEWESLAREVADRWQDSRSALDVLRESGRWSS